VIISH